MCRATKEMNWNLLLEQITKVLKNFEEIQLKTEQNDTENESDHDAYPGTCLSQPITRFDSVFKLWLKCIL